MALSLDDFAAPPLKGPRCSFGVLQASLDPQDAVTLEAALGDPAITSARIAEVLQAEGHDIEDHTVARHRRGKCKC